MSAREVTSTDERTIIAAFARNLHQGGPGVLTVSSLLDLEPNRREDLRKAIWSLSDRGWLVVNTPLHVRDHHECTLVGEGLRVAKSIELTNSH